MENKEAKELLRKYRAGICTDEEIALLESWYLEYQDEVLDLAPEEVAVAKRNIWAGLPIHEKRSHSIKLWPAISAVASIVICVAIGLFLYKKPTQKDNIDSKSVKIVPGGNKAILTLADGSKIDLNDIANGTLANQSGIVINKTADGYLEYTVKEVKGNDHSEFNTIETPRGGQYQVSLPDGTKVWLNAASSLKYPTRFPLNERKVELAGEGYFEVSPNKSSPFKVVSDNQIITVLGTHFNVSTYADDNKVTTTLLEGKVKVELHDRARYEELNPGEQSVLEGNAFKVHKVSNDDAIAWKNNSFVFDNEELGSIMRKLSRWYDVEVVCPPQLSKMIFAGTVSRSKSIKQALRIMELTGAVQFKFEGRRITVMP